MKNRLILLTIVVMLGTTSIIAKTGSIPEKQIKKLEWYFNLGLNIGGTMPVPLPEEVRKITSYNPKINPKVSINTLYRFDQKWGIGTDLSIGTKGMRVSDRVKYMHAKVIVSAKDAQERREVEGYFVGKNTTNVRLDQLAIDIFANYDLTETWELRGGLYLANNIKAKFYGEVSDGYLREGTPNGTEIEIPADNPATFNFDDDLRDFDMGIILGAKFKANERVGVFANMTWGVTDIFYKNQNPIDFKMQNLYLQMGVSYRIK